MFALPEAIQAILECKALSELCMCVDGHSKINGIRLEVYIMVSLLPLWSKGERSNCNVFVLLCKCL